MAKHDDKEARLAEKLRENLRKRKAQAREQTTSQRAEPAGEMGEDAD